MHLSDNLELLSPAGDMKSLKAAINNGADAIYFGNKSFNARMNADNFENMAEVVGLCHLFNVKAFLTLNTIIKENEFEEIKKIIIEGAKSKLDAFIIADISLLPIIKKLAPFVEVHASTQMGIHNRLGAKLLQDLGFDRIILSREVTLEDIKDIRQNIEIPIEVFVQGALCVGFSGACLLSSILTGKSGNRGKCLQLCRNNYSAYFNDKEIANGYLLSTKDLCLLEEINILKDLGVNSIKIEGRLKRSEYVAGMVKAYRYAIDYGYAKNNLDNIKKLYNRGNYTKGYGRDENIIYPYAPNHIGVEIGKVVSENKEFFEIFTDKNIYTGDGFKILRDKKEIGGFSGKGITKINENIYKIKNTMGAKIGDRINITTDSKENIDLIQKQRKLPINFDVKLICGKKASVCATYKNTKIHFFDEIVEKAINKSLSDNEIKQQFSKLGNTYFISKVINVETKDAFLPISKINELKRKAIEKLEKKILSNYKIKESKKYNPFKYTSEHICGNFFEVSNEFTLGTIEKKILKNIVFSPYNYDFKECKSFVNKYKNENTKMFIKLPIFANYEILEQLERIIILFDGIICNNYYTIELAKKFKKIFVLDYNMNIMNCRNIFLNCASNFIYSIECNKNEMKNFDKKGIIYAYGYLPLMYIIHCPRKECGLHCKKCEGKLVYKDKKGCYNIYRKSIENKNCLHILKNSIITDIGNIMSNFDKYIDLTDISVNKDIQIVISEYENKNRNNLGNHTLNHLKRGVD